MIYDFVDDNSEAYDQFRINEWIDECSSCTVTRFEHILGLLSPSDVQNAVACAVRCDNIPVLLFLISERKDLLLFLFLYSCKIHKPRVMHILLKNRSFLMELMKNRSMVQECIGWTLYHNDHFLFNMVCDTIGINEHIRSCVATLELMYQEYEKSHIQFLQDHR